MKLTKTLGLMALLCCVPASIVITGCGGGGSTLPAGTVAGTYSGTYRVTSGPDNGETGPLSLTISGNGNINGSVTSGNDTAAFTGTANTATGLFSVSGLFGISGTGGQSNSTIRVNGTAVSGSGTFALTNGNAGNITFSKVSID